jgi:hypothetical protein
VKIRNLKSRVISAGTAAALQAAIEAWVAEWSGQEAELVGEPLRVAEFAVVFFYTEG